MREVSSATDVKPTGVRHGNRTYIGTKDDVFPPLYSFEMRLALLAMARRWVTTAVRVRAHAYLGHVLRDGLERRRKHRRLASIIETCVMYVWHGGNKRGERPWP